MNSPIVVARPSRRGGLWRFAKSAAVRVNRLHLPVTRVTRPVFAALYLLHVSVREGSIRLRRLLWFEPLFRSRCECVGPGLQMEQLPYVTGAGRIILGCDVRLSGKSSFGFGCHPDRKPTLVIG